MSIQASNHFTQTITMSCPYFLCHVEAQIRFVDRCFVPLELTLQSWPQTWGVDTAHGIAFVSDALYWRDLGGEIHKTLLPAHFTAKSIDFHLGMLLVGGQGGDQKIIALSLPDYQRIEVDHPNLLLKYRKSIDGFFVHGHHLYAIDNHILPKYLLRYQRSSERLEFKDKIKLKSQAPEEKILSGLKWKSYLVLLSKSAHRVGSTSFISFYSLEDFTLLSTLSWHKIAGVGTGIKEITRIKVVRSYLILISNLGVHYLIDCPSPIEQNLKLIYTCPRLVDAHFLDDGSMVVIQKGFGDQKKTIRVPKQSMANLV